MQKDNLTVTFLRTPETEAKYLEQRRLRTEHPELYPPFSPTEKDAVKIFDHWMIIPNDFPYDAITDQHDMLFTRRPVVFDWDLLTQQELDELHIIKKTYIADTYDVFYENLPRGRTVPGHFHLHLLKLRRSA
jgi:hypothetical protein